MKISFKVSLTINRGNDEAEEHHRQGDVFSTTDLAADHTEPELQTGFQRY